MLLVNSDVVFNDKKTFSYFVRRSLSNPNIAVVGCKVLDWEKDIIIHTGTRIKNNKIDDPYCGLHPNDPIANIIERRLWVNGCCSLYNIDILRKENMNFDLDFSPAYFEESDLMTRLNLRGYSVIYEPNAVIRHMRNTTNNIEIEKYSQAFNRNWNLYLKKWEKYFDSKMLYFQ
jgi:GT2 family glycosyltransferase